MTPTGKLTAAEVDWLQIGASSGSLGTDEGNRSQLIPITLPTLSALPAGIHRASLLGGGADFSFDFPVRLSISSNQAASLEIQPSQKIHDVVL